MFILHCTKGKINVIFAKPLEIARWLHGQQKQILFRLLNEFRVLQENGRYCRAGLRGEFSWFAWD